MRRRVDTRHMQVSHFARENTTLRSNDRFMHEFLQVLLYLEFFNNIQNMINNI